MPKNNIYKERGYFMEVTTMVLIAAIVIFVLIIIMLGYIKSPPDKAIIISGYRKICAIKG